MHSTDTDTQKR